MKYTKTIFIIIIFITAFTTQNVFAGCFPREDAYIDLTSKEPNMDCVFVQSKSNCIGFLEIDIVNYCENTLIYKDKKLYKYSKNSTKDNPFTITLTDIPQGVGDKWNEVFYFENNPNKKITLSFEIKGEKESIATSLKEQMKQVIQKSGINFWWFVFFFVFGIVLVILSILRNKF